MTPAPAEAAIHAEGLVKHFGEVRALDGLDLTVPYGTVVGLLGPNGAGKTTTVRVLATLLRADSGHATVAGVDVAADPEAVRRAIGLTGQYAAVDEYLTGRENLDMVGRLYHLPSKYVRARADELLERFSLTDAADRPARTYSGGMRRRLDLSASLVGSPSILFLDEPTTGLDPRSRLQMWDVIADLVRDGTTVLLTTQYLEEADQLADDIVVIDRGRVIAHGTSDELKTQVGGDRLEVVVSVGSDPAVAASALRAVSDGDATVDADTRTVVSPVSGGSTVLVEAVRALDAADVRIDDLALRRPTLDDVFLSLTGHVAEEETPAPTTGRSRGRKEA
ncbi:MAG: ATP-binding cassette domain-containing protein [Frankiales bacterium]|nr:ATP-binding cassette domain-containing protein [Frankiales bacterium]